MLKKIQIKFHLVLSHGRDARGEQHALLMGNILAVYIFFLDSLVFPHM